MLNPKVGDVISMLAASAGKRKYHLCVCCDADNEVARFLFINSQPRWNGELVLDDGKIPGLPMSTSGYSVISCSLVIRTPFARFDAYQAKKVGEVSVELLQRLLEHLSVSPILSPEERRPLVTALRAEIERRKFQS